MTTFAEHRATVESFVDCMHRGADTDALARVLPENVVLTSPLSDEPLTGREAVTEAIQGVSTVAADLTYKEVLSGETHHAAFFRLQIEDTAVDGVDYFLLDADGKIAEVTIWWRPLPTAVEMQGHLAPRGRERHVSWPKNIAADGLRLARHERDNRHLENRNEHTS